MLMLIKYLKPSKYSITSVILNPASGERLYGLLIARKDKIFAKKKLQEVLFLRHEKFDLELYCIPRYAKVTKNGQEG